VLNWFMESKTRYLALMFLVKAADLTSTFLLANRYSWDVEAGYTMVGHLGPVLGHTALSLATIPTAILIGYFAYDRLPAGAEFCVLYFGWISIGNFTQLWLPVIGSYWNIAGLPVLLSILAGRGFDPIWFDRSPTRDELLQNIEEAKSWKTRLFGGEQSAV